MRKKMSFLVKIIFIFLLPVGYARSGTCVKASPSGLPGSILTEISFVYFHRREMNGLDGSKVSDRLMFSIPGLE